MLGTRRAARGRVAGTASPLDRALARAHLTQSGALLLVLGVAGWLLARGIGSRAVYVLAYATFLTMIVAAVSARRRLAIDVTRSRLPLRMRVGQKADVTLTVAARRRASTIVLEETVPEWLGQQVRVPIASAVPGHPVEHTYTLRPSLRGVYELGPTVATWTDPFSLTNQSQRLREPVSIIVHPSTEALSDRVLTRMWEDPPVRPPVSKPWPTGFEFYGMRDYVPGDDVRRIVWKAVAKTGRMLVRESEQGITDRVVVALDTDRAAHKSGVPSDTFETAVKVAASIGSRHLKDGFSVTLWANQAKLGDRLRGPRARLSMLDQLAKLQLSKIAFSEIGQHLSREARSGAHFVIITPHLDKAMASRLRLVLERGVSAVIVQIMWPETDPESVFRATALGCPVVEVPHDVPLAAVFAHMAGASVRR